MKEEIIHVIIGWQQFERPAHIPDGWHIYNASRPFPAHETWVGDFLHGVFFGAIDPDGEWAEDYRCRAVELDAHRLVFHKHEDVETWGRAFCAQLGVDYDSFKFGDVAQSFLRHKRQEADDGIE